MIELRLGVFTVTFAVPGSNSLKDKRRVLRSVIGRAKGSRRSFNVCVAEVGHQDDPRRAGIAASVVSADTNCVYRTFGSLERFFLSFPEIVVEGFRTEVIPWHYRPEEMQEAKYGDQPDGDDQFLPA